MSGRQATCRTCGGTGKIVSLNSAFITDGLRKLRCGICAGSGVSSFQPDAAYARWQANNRATFPVHHLIAERHAKRGA